MRAISEETSPTAHLVRHHIHDSSQDVETGMACLMQQEGEAHVLHMLSIRRSSLLSTVVN
jgi:hypothetical protein